MRVSALDSIKVRASWRSRREASKVLWESSLEFWGEEGKSTGTQEPDPGKEPALHISQIYGILLSESGETRQFIPSRMRLLF